MHHCWFFDVQAQYVFVHDALNEYLICRETDIPAAMLRKKVEMMKSVAPGETLSGIAEEFKVNKAVVLIAYNHSPFTSPFPLVVRCPT